MHIIGIIMDNKRTASPSPDDESVQVTYSDIKILIYINLWVTQQKTLVFIVSNDL